MTDSVLHTVDNDTYFHTDKSGIISCVKIQEEALRVQVLLTFSPLLGEVDILVST